MKSVAQKRVNMFYNFCCNSGEKLRTSGETTPVIVRLVHELEKYRTMLPALKFVRGEVFSDKHWIEMYSLLGIPTSITVDKLTFGHFMRVCFNCGIPVLS